MKKFIVALAVVPMIALGALTLADVPEECSTYPPDIRGAESIRDEVVDEMNQAFAKGDHATLMALSGRYVSVLEQLYRDQSAMLECIRNN